MYFNIDAWRTVTYAYVYIFVYIYFTGKNLSELTKFLYEDLLNIEEWLRCNKLSLNVLKTNCTIFTTKNTLGHDVDIFVNNARIERVYVSKFLGVQID